MSAAFDMAPEPEWAETPEAANGQHQQPADTDSLAIAMSIFPTSKPAGPAYGIEVRTTWGEFAQRFMSRRVGAKDGVNFIPARFRPEFDGSVRRLKEYVTARTGIALDVETNKLTGEVPPTFAEAAGHVQAQGWAAVLYTSHSHTPAEPRYRILVPLSEEIDHELPAPEVISGILGLGGVLDTSKIGPASLFFFPSSAKASLDGHEIAVLEGMPISATWMRETAGAIVEAQEAVRARQHAEAMAIAEQRRQDRIRAGFDPSHSLIEEIRQHLDLTGILLNHGYKAVGKKFLAPNSQTGIAGAYILHGKDGIERVYSHHGSDPLAEGNLPSWCRSKAMDAVDAAVILEYGSNLKRGLHQLAKRFGIKSKRTKGPRPDAESSSDKATDEPAGAASAPETEPDPECEAAIEALVDEFNGRYMVVNEAGRAVIYAPGFNTSLQRRTIDHMTFGDLRALYMNRVLKVGIDEKGRDVFKQVADLWLKHHRRQQFIDGVTFDPTCPADKPGVLNLWEGYAVKPKPGDWSLMKSHIHSIICAGDDVRFDFLIGWLARMFQRPAEQGEVAVVMKGGEGTGKGTLAKALGRIIGHHALAISNGKHLVGHFNLHLRDVVFLFADEAFFAGDRAHVGVLKSLITEPYLTVEAKYANAVQAPNFLHVMMASNEEWVVPAAMDARRFFVLEVDGACANNHDYFGKIWDQMEAGGYAAMLHDLLAYDLSAFNVRAVPTTEGLQRQRKLSLPTTEAWWFDCLQRGYVLRSKLGLEKDLHRWYAEVSTELLFASYTDFAERRRERHPLSRETLGRFMRKMDCTPKRLLSDFTGEHMTDVTDQNGHIRRTARMVISHRPPGYTLGALSLARDAFEEATGLTVEWNDGLDGSPHPDDVSPSEWDDEPDPRENPDI